MPDLNWQRIAWKASRLPLQQWCFVRVFKWMRSPHGYVPGVSLGFQGIRITPFAKSYSISQTHVTSKEEKLVCFSGGTYVSIFKYFSCIISSTIRSASANPFDIAAACSLIHPWNAGDSTHRRNAICRFWCCERSSCDVPIALLGGWIHRHADDVLFFFCPPAPVPLKYCHSKSCLVTLKSLVRISILSWEVDSA